MYRTSTLVLAFFGGLAAASATCDGSGCEAMPSDETALLQVSRAQVERGIVAHNASSSTRGAPDDDDDKKDDDDDKTPFGALGCVKSVPFDHDSLWVPGYSRRWHSCAAHKDGHFATGQDVRPQGASMCADADGKPDHTSIYVDMGSLPDPTGCFAWVTAACPLDLRRVAKIEFDLDVKDCDALWASPLWMSPLEWIAPQGLSGEVDFIEMCPVPRLATNLGCYSLDDKSPKNCMDGMHGTWGHAKGLNEPKHMVMKIQDSNDVKARGDLDVLLCDLDGSDCKTVAHYAKYMSSIHPTKGRQEGGKFEFRSDVWNGYENPKDGGWKGCKAVHNPTTKCQYVVANIKITSSDGKPAFADGKCKALNAKE